MTKSQAKSVESTRLETGRKGSRRSAANPGGRQPKPAPGQVRNAAPASEKKTIKRDQLAAMLVRDQGATVDQMRKTTGWIPHTVRAALTGLKKHGYAINSDKVDGLRTYRAVAPE
jgi:hypothetical protein